MRSSGRLEAATCGSALQHGPRRDSRRHLVHRLPGARPDRYALVIWRVGLKDGWRRVLGFGAALAVGLPLLLVSALQPNHVDAQQGNLHVWMVRTLNLVRCGVLTIIDPTHYSWMLPVLAGIALLLIVAERHRPRLAILGGVLVTAMVFMFTPGLVDALSGLIPYWLAWRLRFVAEAIGFVTVAGGLPGSPVRAANPAGPHGTVAGGVVRRSGRVSTGDLDYAVDRQRHRLLWRSPRAAGGRATRRPLHALVVAVPVWSLVLPRFIWRAGDGCRISTMLTRPTAGLLERSVAADDSSPTARPDRRRRASYSTVRHRLFILIRNDAVPLEHDRFASVGELVSTGNGFRLYRVKR